MGTTKNSKEHWKTNNTSGAEDNFDIKMTDELTEVACGHVNALSPSSSKVINQNILHETKFDKENFHRSKTHFVDQRQLLPKNDDQG